jgi:hypothetical protein
VRDHELHAGRFADDAPARSKADIGEIGDQPADADAAHFLVIRQREMQRSREVALDHLGHQRERDGDEALHVADAASHQAVGDLDGLPRIRMPFLTIDRNHVGVT